MEIISKVMITNSRLGGMLRMFKLEADEDNYLVRTIIFVISLVCLTQI